MDPKLEQLIRWIAGNTESESVFLSPHTRWHVGAQDLLDQVATIFDIPKEEIGKVVDEVADAVEVSE